MALESTLAPRPLDRVALAKESARDNLSSRLISAYGIDKRYADQIARMVVDPTAVRHQIDQPLIKRFPGGVAKLLVADVYTPAVSASLINPRETESRVYPVAARPDEQVWPPLLVDSAPNGQPVLILTAHDRQHVEATLIQSAAHLRQKIDLMEAIKLDGVLEPVTIFLAEIHHADGSEPVIVPMSVDGSTRTTHCHDLTSFDPVEVVYRWSQAPSREWRGVINQILSVQDDAEVEVGEQEKAAHRAIKYQARILVGVEAVRGGEPVSVVTANRAIVGGIHVGRPEEWPQGSEIDEIAEAVLDQLVADHRILPELRPYLAGLLEPQELEKEGFSPYPDVRAAQIVHTMYAERNSLAISAGYRSLVAKRKLGNFDKPNIAAELIMRAFRSNLKQTEISAVRSALQRTINMREWRESPWRVSGRSPDELLEAALHELHSGSETAKEARLELGLLGAYWLLSKRALKRETRTLDQRSPASVIEAMLESAHGLRQLHRAVVDGRSESSGNTPIRAVDLEGNILTMAAGGTKTVTDQSLRDAFPDPDRAEERTRTGQSQLDPMQQLARGVQDLRRQADKLHELVQRLNLYGMNSGVPEPTAEYIAEKLRQAAKHVGRWGDRYALLNPRLSIDDLDEVDLVPESEE